jgi:hypothetical protein
VGLLVRGLITLDLVGLGVDSHIKITLPLFLEIHTLLQ